WRLPRRRLPRRRFPWGSGRGVPRRLPRRARIARRLPRSGAPRRLPWSGCPRSGCPRRPRFPPRGRLPPGRRPDLDRPALGLERRRPSLARWRLVGGALPRLVLGSGPVGLERIPVGLAGRLLVAGCLLKREPRPFARARVEPDPRRALYLRASAPTRARAGAAPERGQCQSRKQEREAAAARSSRRIAGTAADAAFVRPAFGASARRAAAGTERSAGARAAAAARRAARPSGRRRAAGAGRRDPAVRNGNGDAAVGDRTLALVAILARWALDARAPVLTGAADANARRRVALHLVASGVDAGPVARAGLSAGAIAAAALRETGAALADLTVGAGDAGAGIDAISDPAYLAGRADDVVAAADADAAVAGLIGTARDIHARRIFAEPVGLIAGVGRPAWELGGAARTDADTLAADLARRAEPGRVRVVDDPVAVVIEQIAGFRPRLDVLTALDVHAAIGALGGAARADAGHPRIAGLPATLAVDAADVEDEVVEV